MVVSGVVINIMIGLLIFSGVVINIMIGLLILGVSLWGVYLTHYRDRRSDVKIHAEQPESTPEFSGGTNSIGDGSYWTTSAFYLKIINEEERGAYIRSISEELVCLIEDGRSSDPQGTRIESRSTDNIVGVKLDPHLPERYRVSLKIIPKDHIGILIRHDYALIRHILEVEDNKGSYETTHHTWIELIGPENAIENWKEAEGEMDSHQ
jgi:hypothetical protein